MRKIINYYETKKTIAAETVEFPVYRKSDALIDEADIIHFYKWNADGTEYEIIREARYSGDTPNGYTFEIHNRSLNDVQGYYGDSKDSLFGLGDHALTADEFDKVLDAAINWLAAFKE